MSRDREAWRPYLDAAFEIERWELVRARADRVLVFAGVPVWLAASWPGLLGGGLRALGLGVWAAIFGVRVLAVLAVRVWRRRCARLRADLDGFLTPRDRVLMES